MEAMRGDRIIVRMRTAEDKGIAYTVGLVFCYWADAADMGYNGSVLAYQHDEDERNNVRMLEAFSLSSDPNEWHTEAAGHMHRHGPDVWLRESEVVCTVSGREIPAAHPLALSHLARFQAAVAMTDPATALWGNAMSSFQHGCWRITLGIASRRLDGLVKAELKNARRAIEVI